MRKPLTTVPPTSAHLVRQLKGKQQVIQKRAVCIVRGENQYCAPCIIGGESRGIRISSRNSGRIKNTTELVLYKTLHYFVPD